MHRQRNCGKLYREDYQFIGVHKCLWNVNCCEDYSARGIIYETFREQY